ncbi:lipase maturation factor family protein [Occallatibacter riparius]|uniref:Lipase maturation factor family protein n=1 Tax=Occallatibacter riparius TaxID=1002689 RepID=A0A9J7BT19_9BACT|nr:lipase maturation factor family protein [Occallatibacter riparius]UWZ86051.1 lipase maturation factor family protein [Occallatibacter riparius]
MHLLTNYFGDLTLARLLVQRGMAAIYLVAFLTVLNQFKPLLGERGLLPVPEFLRRVSFREAPSLFHWRYSDGLADAVAWSGVVLSVLALAGITDAGPIWVSVSAWLVLYALYLSIVNVGQTFFGFGWESMLLEAGFFTAFLGPAHVRPSVIPILILRWMLFRTEMGAGLIKLRHDQCWRDLTCMYYHYETQPLPNALSWYFHWIPKPVHRFSAGYSHFVQVVAPFFLFAPQPVAFIAGVILVSQQLILIISGNYSWLNWLTVVLGFSAFDGHLLRYAGSGFGARPLAWDVVLWALALATTAMSIQPTLNLISKDQMMNYSYNRFHLVGAYGAFGNVSKERYEVVIEGTADAVLTAATEWKEYEFKGKPGDVRRTPPQVAPYHLRLDWMVWFLPFGVAVTSHGIHVYGHKLWFFRFIKRLLTNDATILRLLRRNPFPDAPPAYVRAQFYQYSYTTAAERKVNGAWWSRRLLGSYLAAVGLETLREV